MSGSCRTLDHLLKHFVEQMFLKDFFYKTVFTLESLHVWNKLGTFLCFTGCQAVMALSRDSRAHQDGFCKENGVPPLVRLLRGSRTTQKTLLNVIKALGFLCIGIISLCFVIENMCFNACDENPSLCCRSGTNR